MLPRTVLERARSVAEAIEVLHEVPGSGFGLVYVLADAGGDTAIVEKVHDRTRGALAPGAVRLGRQPFRRRGAAAA